MYPDSSKTDAIQRYPAETYASSGLQTTRHAMTGRVIDNACRLRQILAAGLPYWPGRHR